MTYTQQILQNEVDYRQREVIEASKRLNIASRYFMLLGNEDLSDVESVNVSTCWDDTKQGKIELYLKSDVAETSKLPHRLAHLVEGQFTKEKHWNGTSLRLTGTTPDGLVIEITGYVGQCRIVETTEPITDEDYMAAVARVPKVRTIRTIKCEAE
jgi:hypothetical protein